MQHFGSNHVIDLSYAVKANYEGEFEEPDREGKVELAKDVITLCAPADLDADVARTVLYYIFFYELYKNR